MSRFLVLVPAGEEWHVATRAGRLVTTTERTQVALGRIEGKRAPLILADNVGTGRALLPTVDLLELLTDQVEPASDEPAPESTDRPPAPEGPPPGPPNPPRPPKDRPVG